MQPYLGPQRFADILSSDRQKSWKEVRKPYSINNWLKVQSKWVNLGLLIRHWTYDNLLWPNNTCASFNKLLQKFGHVQSTASWSVSIMWLYVWTCFVFLNYVSYSCCFFCFCFVLCTKRFLTCGRAPSYIFSLSGRPCWRASLHSSAVCHSMKWSSFKLYQVWRKEEIHMDMINVLN